MERREYFILNFYSILSYLHFDRNSALLFSSSLSNMDEKKKFRFAFFFFIR